MEAIKNAIGLGSSQVQSGQEPVSGETGSGTASKPYDGGNANGQSGSATDESVRDTTTSKTYSSGNTGSKSDTIADQLTSTFTGNGQDNQDSPEGEIAKALGQSISSTTTFRHMSDTTAAQILHEQNLIFSNDTLTVQERIHQLYMLLLRYDKGGETIPETPKPIEGNTKHIGGGPEPRAGATFTFNERGMEEEQGVSRPSEKPAEAQAKPTDDPSPNSNHNGTEKEQGPSSYLKPVEAPAKPTGEETNITNDSQSTAKPPINTDEFPGSVIHDESEVLHGGQDKKEEINVPIVGTNHSEPSKDGANTTDIITSGLDEGGTDQKPKTGESIVNLTDQNADGGDFGVAKQVPAQEADRIPEEKVVSRNSEAEAASSSSGNLKHSGPTKKSRGQKIKEKLHIGKK